jgi:hypothetical protein
MSSISLNTSTNCMHPSTNIDITLTNNKSKTHFSTQTIACVTNENDHRRRKRKNSKIKTIRVIMNNETPLLSHLFGTHKFHSDSNLNILTKQ